jgi:hypothetical protein
MRSIIITAVTGLFLSPLLVTPSNAAASVCKGLDTSACAANASCRWMPERVAGTTITKAGTPAKRSAKAHCRKGTPAKA